MYYLKTPAQIWMKPPGMIDNDLDLIGENLDLEAETYTRAL